MQLYYICDLAEAVGIERRGFSARQAAYTAGFRDETIMIWLTDRVRRLDPDREVCFAVDVPPDADFVREIPGDPRLVTQRVFEGSAADINRGCGMRRLSEDEARALLDQRS